MRILHVVEAWKGGIATYVHALQKLQVKQGHEVIFAMDNKKFLLDPKDIPGEKVYYNSSRNPVLIWKVKRQIDAIVSKIKPDIIYSHSSFPGVYCRFKCDYKSRVIHIPHGFSLVRTDVGWMQHYLYRFMERMLARYCSKIICMSVDEARWVRRIGIPEEKIALIRSSIDDKPISIYSAASGHEGRFLKVGFFGRNGYQKGFDFVLKSIPYLDDSIKVHTFGDLIPVSDGILQNRLIQHGWIAQDRVHDSMLDMDVIIVPSRWEGWCLTVVEAMRAGRAVIVSSVSSLPEMVIHQFNGIVLQSMVPRYIASVINNLTHEECARMGNNGRRVYEDSFTYDRYAEYIEDLQNQVQLKI